MAANDSEISPPAPTPAAKRRAANSSTSLTSVHARLATTMIASDHATTRRQLKRCAAKVIATVVAAIPNISAEATCPAARSSKPRYCTMPCTKPGCTINTSGPTTPSRIALTSDRDSLASPARAVPVTSMPSPSLEAVAEADTVPARFTVRELVEAEGAGEVEGVDQVLLVRDVVDEGRDLPRRSVIRIREPQVAHRVAVLEGHRDVLDVVVDVVLVRHGAQDRGLAAEHRPLVAHRGVRSDVRRRHHLALAQHAGRARDVLRLGVEDGQAQSDVPAVRRRGRKLQLAAGHLGIRVEDDLVQQLEAEGLEVLVVVVERGGVEARAPAAPSRLETYLVAGQRFLAERDGRGGVAGENLILIEEADVEPGRLGAARDRAVQEHVVVRLEVELELAAPRVIVVLGEIAHSALIEVERDIRRQTDDVREETRLVDVQIVEFLLIVREAGPGDERELVRQVELELP